MISSHWYLFLIQFVISFFRYIFYLISNSGKISVWWIHHHRRRIQYSTCMHETRFSRHVADSELNVSFKEVLWRFFVTSGSCETTCRVLDPAPASIRYSSAGSRWARNLQISQNAWSSRIITCESNEPTFFFFN